jgi:hypothetical protein
MLRAGFEPMIPVTARPPDRHWSIILTHWFRKWAVPPPGGRWDYLGGLRGQGALQVGPSERVVSLFTFDRLEPIAKHLLRCVFKIVLLLSLSELCPLVTFIYIYDLCCHKRTNYWYYCWGKVQILKTHGCEVTCLFSHLLPHHRITTSVGWWFI